MNKICEDGSSRYYEEIINGNPVRYKEDKKTLKTWINIDDVFRACGGSGKFEDWLKTDEGLDLLNDWKQKHPTIPFEFLFGRFDVPTQNTQI